MQIKKIKQTYNDYSVEMSFGQLMAIKNALASDHSDPLADELFAELNWYLDNIPGPGEDEEDLKREAEAAQSGMASPEAEGQPMKPRADDLLPSPEGEEGGPEEGGTLPPEGGEMGGPEGAEPDFGPEGGQGGPEGAPEGGPEGGAPEPGRGGPEGGAGQGRPPEHEANRRLPVPPRE